MPCYQTRTTSVELKNADDTLLKAAMEALGVEYYDYDYDRASGRVTVRSTFTLTDNEIKVAYSEQVVASVQKRFGWKVNEPKTKQAQQARQQRRVYVLARR
jgi:hypothetical protein